MPCKNNKSDIREILEAFGLDEDYIKKQEEFVRDYAKYYEITEKTAMNILLGRRWNVDKQEYEKWYDKWSGHETTS